MRAGFAGRVAAERTAGLIEPRHADIVNPILREKGLKSLLGVPLLVEGRVIGVLHAGSLIPAMFTDEDTDLLQRAADRAALAINARLYERQRGLAEEIQRSLIPRAAALPGMTLAGRYRPARGRGSAATGTTRSCCRAAGWRWPWATWWDAASGPPR